MKKGSDRQFTELINENKVRMYKMAYIYLQNEQDALEAVQETTYRAYLNFSKLKNPEYFSTWLLRILINYCMDELRRKQKTVQLIQEGKDSIPFNDLQIEIRLALEHLEPKYRQIVFLKYFGDLSLREIAEILDFPEGTVKTRLYKGLDILKSLISEEGKAHVNL